MKAVMYGAGNIGRGFIVQSFYESGYETAMIDVNMTVIDRLNSDHCYPVYITKDGNYDIHWVKNVSGIDGKNTDAIADAIAEADVMATAVGVNVLKWIAPNIAAGIKRRCEKNILVPLNCIVCENMIGADAYLAGMIKESLTADEIAYFERYFALVEPSIGRMVPATPKEIAEQNPLAVCVEEYFELPVDRAAFKGEIPPVKNFVPYAPFDFYIQRKLFMHNMSHAVVAYLGKLAGYTYIWEAVADSRIRQTAAKALDAISHAMSKEHGVELSSLQTFSDNLLIRYENKLLGDTVDRVGKDTVRKLGANDRLIGAASLCVKQGIDPEPICLGVAAALLFAPDEDEAAKQVAADCAKNGVGDTLKKYSGLCADSPIVQTVEKLYHSLKHA